MQNFRRLTAQVKFYPIYTWWLLLVKAYKISAKKSVGEVCLMTLKIDVKFEEKRICCFKNDRNLPNFDLNTRNSQNFYFDWFLLCKIYNVWPRTVQRSYLSLHWRLMQNSKKNWHMVWKMTWGIWQIFTKVWEVSKLGL